MRITSSRIFLQEYLIDLVHARVYDRLTELYMDSAPVDRVRGQQLPTVGPTLDILDWFKLRLLSHCFPC